MYSIVLFTRNSLFVHRLCVCEVNSITKWAWGARARGMLLGLGLLLFFSRFLRKHLACTLYGYRWVRNVLYKQYTISITCAEHIHYPCHRYASASWPGCCFVLFCLVFPFARNSSSTQMNWLVGSEAGLWRTTKAFVYSEWRQRYWEMCCAPCDR